MHVIALIIVVLVVVLPVVYVGYPKIAQGDVNDSTLTITQMTITDPAPDSLHLNLTQVIGSHSHYHPWFDEFDANVTLLGSATPFAVLQIPRVQSKDGAVVRVDQRLQLDNVSAFGEYSKAVMLNEEVNLNVYGRPKMREGKLPKITVTYNKTVTMKGLNALKGFNVTEFQILLSQQPDGSNMNGTVYIPNPTVMTLEMGNLTLSLSVDGTPIGQSYLQNLVLTPGDNFVPMRSTVNETVVLGMITSANATHRNGILPVEITGNSSVYNGKELPYFTEALAANKLTVTLDVGKALLGIGLNINSTSGSSSGSSGSSSGGGS